MPTFTNQATLTYNNTVAVSNLAVGTLIDDLSLTKRAVVGSYSATDRNLTFVVSLVNASTAPITGLTLTDNLGAYTAGAAGTVYPLVYLPDSLTVYVNGVLQTPTPTVTAGPPLQIEGLTVPAEGNIVLVYETTTTAFAPLAPDGAINNLVTANGMGMTATANATVTVANAPSLTIGKTMSPDSVSPGETLTYTFTIQNTGNTATGADAVLTDTFNPRLAGLTVTYNGTPWTEGVNYNYDEDTGLFTTVAGQIAVGAATYTTDPVTGAVAVSPGIGTLVVSGTVVTA